MPVISVPTITIASDFDRPLGDGKAYAQAVIDAAGYAS
jgi:hypothetical protein